MPNLITEPKYTDRLKLLTNKNRCLLKFLDKSKSFLSEIKNGDFTNLELFQNYRDTILTIMKLYDRKFGKTTEDEISTEILPAVIGAIDQLQSSSKELIRLIFETDREIISIMEDEKIRLTSDLTQITRSEQMIRKFKSRWISECGEKLDNQL